MENVCAEVRVSFFIISRKTADGSRNLEPRELEGAAEWIIVENPAIPSVNRSGLERGSCFADITSTYHGYGQSQDPLPRSMLRRKFPIYLPEDAPDRRRRLPNALNDPLEERPTAETRPKGSWIPIAGEFQEHLLIFLFLFFYF